MDLEKVIARLAQQVEHRFYGKYRGFVVENADPEQLGRLKLQVPSVLGKEVVTGWATPCMPYGGMANQGTLFIPEVGAGVWVEFEEGDLEFPIWVGTFWSKPEDNDNNSELPKPNNTEDGTDAEESIQGDEQEPPTRKIIKTKKGHTLQFEDADEQEMIAIIEGIKKHRLLFDGKGILIKTAKEHIFQLQDTDDDKEDNDDAAMIKIAVGVHKHEICLDKQGITIKDGVNEHEILLNDKGITINDGINKHEIVLNDQGIMLTDGKNSGNQIQMTSSGITIESSQDVTIKGTSIKVEATDALNLQANTTVDAKSNGQMNLTATAKLTAKGSLIDLNP
jgi:hypothetical protein